MVTPQTTLQSDTSSVSEGRNESHKLDAFLDKVETEMASSIDDTGANSASLSPLQESLLWMSSNGRKSTALEFVATTFDELLMLFYALYGLSLKTYKRTYNYVSLNANKALNTADDFVSNRRRQLQHYRNAASLNLTLLSFNMRAEYEEALTKASTLFDLNRISAEARAAARSCLSHAADFTMTGKKRILNLASLARSFVIGAFENRPRLSNFREKVANLRSAANERIQSFKARRSAVKESSDRVPYSAQASYYTHKMAHLARQHGPAMLASAGTGAGLRVMAQFACSAFLTTVPGALVIGAVTGATVGVVREVVQLHNGTKPLADGEKLKGRLLKTVLEGGLRGLSYAGIGAFGGAVYEGAKALVKTTHKVYRGCRGEDVPGFNRKQFLISMGLNIMSGIGGALWANHVSGNWGPGSRSGTSSHNQGALPNTNNAVPQTSATNATPAQSGSTATGAHTSTATKAPTALQETTTEKNVTPVENKALETSKPQEATKSHVDLPPPVRMPKSLEGLVTDKQFHSIPRTSQIEIARALKSGNPKLQIWGEKELSYRLFEQNTVASNKAGANIALDALEKASETGLLESRTGRKLAGDAAYLLERGIGGTPRDLKKAAFYGILAGDNSVGRQVVQRIEAAHPEIVEGARNILMENKGLRQALNLGPKPPMPHIATGIQPATAPAPT